MLTYQDCVGLCDLTEAEIAAIAEHEHLPHMVALELGQYLLHCPDGVRRIRRMIVDDIAAARASGDARKALVLRGVLHRFVASHPDRAGA